MEWKILPYFKNLKILLLDNIGYNKSCKYLLNHSYGLNIDSTS